MNLRGVALACGLMVMAVAATVQDARSEETRAGDARQGVLNAVAFAPLPEGLPVMVRPLDDSDANLALKERFEAHLKGRGFVIVDTPQVLVVSFETRDELGGFTPGSQRTIFEVQGVAGNSAAVEDVEYRFKLFDSQDGGVLNRGNRGTGTSIPGRFRLDVTVDDRSAGKRLWHGWAVAVLDATNPTADTDAIVPMLVDKVGKTVREEVFELP